MSKPIKINMKSLDLKPSKSRNFYETEATSIIKKLNTSDRNFKYFLREVVLKSKEHVDVESLREIVSDLQRYICSRINEEDSEDSYLVPLRNKIKKPKRQFFD